MDVDFVFILVPVLVFNNSSKQENEISFGSYLHYLTEKKKNNTIYMCALYEYITRLRLCISVYIIYIYMVYGKRYAAQIYETH